MNRSHVARVLLLVIVLVGGCTTDHSRTAPDPASRPAPAGQAQLQTDAQAIVNAFTGAVARSRGGPLAEAPVVQVRNTPQLISFIRSSNQIIVPWWETTSAEMKSVFRTFTAGSDAEAEQFFRTFFNRFLIAHEAGHWFQDHANRRKSTLYENEDAANRLAVGFWRTQPGGERFLSELEQLADRAAANLPDPTPAGENPIVYFGANYQALGREPLKYGYYQFRFMRDAIRDRTELDFSKMVSATLRPDDGPAVTTAAAPPPHPHWRPGVSARSRPASSR